MKQSLYRLFAWRLPVFLLVVLLSGCSTQFDCEDTPVAAIFVGYSKADIDTLVLRKFQAGNNFQQLLDTLIVTNGNNTYYQIPGDTITVVSSRWVKVGYDWQLYIPAKNKTILLTDIVSEKETGKCGRMPVSNKKDCICYNKVFSMKMDGQAINFQSEHRYAPKFYVHL
jgi:hypothetical protein